MRKSTSVSQVMTPRVIVANTYHTFTQVRSLFLELNMHHLPVVDENERVIGIISSSDMLRAYAESIPFLPSMDDATLNEHVKISDLMTANPLTISSIDTIGSVAELFVQQKIHSLPVVDNGKIIGIITMNDLNKHFAQMG